MQRDRIVSMVIIFFFLSGVATAKQAAPQPALAQSGNQNLSNSVRDCGGKLTMVREARQAVERNRRSRDTEAQSANATETNGWNDDVSTIANGAEHDLQVLERAQMELAGCILASQTLGSTYNSPGGCFGEMLLNFEMRHDGEPERDIPIGRLPGGSAFFFESGMTIDADGAPNAYHPDNLGLDDLANAGSPGSWEGLAKDGDGEPYIQGPGDPFPGYYVSSTALADRSKPVNDPTRYVDASKIPFIVLPGGMARQLGARPGDFAVVFNQRNGKSSYAIFGDVGPFNRIGEGSVALAENLGIRSDARNGGARRGIVYLVFPGSGNRQPRTIDEINAQGQSLMQDWESSFPQAACTAEQPGLEGSENKN